MYISWKFCQSLIYWLFVIVYYSSIQQAGVTCATENLHQGKLESGDEDLEVVYLDIKKGKHNIDQINIKKESHEINEINIKEEHLSPLMSVANVGIFKFNLPQLHWMLKIYLFLYFLPDSSQQEENPTHATIYWTSACCS